MKSMAVEDFLRQVGLMLIVASFAYLAGQLSHKWDKDLFDWGFFLGLVSGYVFLAGAIIISLIRSRKNPSHKR